MRKGIHPEYVDAKIICSCGNVIQTRSTKPELHIEICSSCHPFFTGKQKFVDTAGRVERYQKRYKHYQRKSDLATKKTTPKTQPEPIANQDESKAVAEEKQEENSG